MVLYASFSGDTPHGCPPFTKWKNGWGFGKRLRSYTSDPMVQMPGRCSPQGNAYYKPNRFHKARLEIGQANTFGIGDRPEYGQEQKDWSVSPNAYGDVARKLSAIRKDTIYKNIVQKGRLKDPRENSSLGPGPARFNVCSKTGVNAYKWTINCRHLDTYVYNEEASKPGPGYYETRGKPGENYPIKHGTLCDISFKHKIPATIKKSGPGPGAYALKRVCDQYNVTPHYRPKSH